MDIIIIPYGALPCTLQEFTIDGVEHNAYDYVSMEGDSCPEDCDCYGCHNMHAESLEVGTVKENLSKRGFNFTDEQIVEIQSALVEALDVGDCGWCE